MGDFERREVEFAAEEEDSSPVALEVMEASGCRLDALDAAVEPFADRVGDVVIAPVEKFLEMGLEHSSDFLDRVEPGSDRPAIPLLEVIARLLA